MAYIIRKNKFAKIMKYGDEFLRIIVLKNEEIIEQNKQITKEEKSWIS